MRIILHHGTAYAFDHFRIPASGVHFGSLDQAAHRASQQMARMPIKEFAALAPDARGFCGRIILAEITAEHVLDLEDQRDDAGWAQAISKARAAGYQAIRYENAFEGRRPETSVVVWDAESIRILDPDLTRPAVRDLEID